MAKAAGIKLPRAEWGRSSLVWHLHSSMRCLAWVSDRNHEAFRHSARVGALHASMKALSVGLPGQEKSIADMRTLLRHQMAGNVAAQVAIYLKLVERLCKAGAEAVAITSIARHFCIDAFKETSPLPVIDLLAEVRSAVDASGFRKVGVIGTRVVMETRFYEALRTAEVIPPSDVDLADVHEAYVAVASTGAVSEEQRDTFFHVGRRLVDQHGVEAVMLGGTDLALAFDGRDCGFLTLDCASIHVEAITRAVLL